MRSKRPQWAACCGVAALLCCVGAATAQPVNDTCATATPILAVPFDSGDIDAFTATDDPENPTCDSTTNAAGANNGVWFVYTPATTTTLILNELDSLDTVTSIWTGACGALTQVACSDPETSNFTFTAGTTYHIMVSRWSATNPVAGNTYQLTLGEGGTCCNPSTGACTFGAASACASPSVFTAGGACTPNPCPQQPVPPNDLCTAAIALTAGVPVVGNNSSATSTGDGPAATCQTSSNKGVWYSFNSPGGNFQVSTCGSPQDTVLTVFTSPDCVTFTQVTGGCDDDACDGVNPPGSGLASNIASVSLPAGQYLIRVSSFGATPTGNDFTLVVNTTVAGACCSATGTCTSAAPSACTGTSVYQGDNTTCSPNPCPQPGACCIGTCCTSTLPAACTGTFTAGLTCGAGACGFPSNDECTGAAPAHLGANPGNNCGANTSVTPTPTTQCGTTTGAGGARDVFFTFTPGTTGLYTFDTCDAVGFDTVLAVYAGCPVDNSTVPLACNDDTVATCAASGLRSRIPDLALTAGTNYIVRVAAWAGGTAEGNFVLNITAAGIPDTGACCCGSSCRIAAAAACTGSNTTFAGAGTACNPAGNFTAPCCKGDYNKTGAPPTVQDIFDFLSGYFSNSPCADSNDSGAVSVQDIFDFLSAYFGGC